MFKGHLQLVTWVSADRCLKNLEGRAYSPRTVQSLQEAGCLSAFPATCGVFGIYLLPQAWCTWGRGCSCSPGSQAQKCFLKSDHLQVYYISTTLLGRSFSHVKVFKWIVAEWQAMEIVRGVWWYFTKNENKSKNKECLGVLWYTALHRVIKSRSCDIAHGWRWQEEMGCLY